MEETRDLRDIAQELTERLNSEPEFRLLFVKNPAKALAQLGLKITKAKAEKIRDAMTVSLLEAAALRGGVVPFIYPK